MYNKNLHVLDNFQCINEILKINLNIRIFIDFSGNVDTFVKFIIGNHGNNLQI